MKSKFKKGFLLFAFFASAAFRPASSADEVRQLSIRGLRVEPSGALSIFVALQNGEGKPVVPQNPDYFRVEIDGKPLESPKFDLKQIAKSGEGRAVLMGVDVSGSMAVGMNAVSESLSQYILSMRPSIDKMGVGQIGTEWKIVHEFSSDQVSLKKSIEALKALDLGTTALFESVHLGVQLLQKASVERLPARRSMIVVTDGLNEKSGRTADECIALAKKSLIQVHSLIYLPKPNSRMLSAKGELEKISRDSGGITSTVSDAKQISNYFIQLQKEMDNELLLSISGEGLPRDGTEHGLVLRYFQASDSTRFVSTASQSLKSGEISEKSCQSGKKVSTGEACPEERERQAMEEMLPFVLLSFGVVLILGGVLWSIRSRKRIRESEALAFSQAQEQALAEAQRAIQSAENQAGQQAGLGENHTMRSEELRNSHVGQLRPRKTEYRPPSSGAARGIAIRAVGGECEGFYALVPATGAKVGRDPANGIVIASDSVSGHHAEIYLASTGQFSIRDLSSTNGTFINGVKLGNQPEFLAVGSKLRLGAVTLVVEQI